MVEIVWEEKGVELCSQQNYKNLSTYLFFNLIFKKDTLRP